MTEFEALKLFDDTIKTRDENATPETTIIEQATKFCLQDFFEKRRMSGDARPYGPRDIYTVYKTVFGITKRC